MKKINLKFEINVKKVFFLISFLFFVYLLYLSIPSLYDTGRVQKDIIKKLDKDFELNFGLSTDISYRILPKPHFIIKDCELVEIDSSVTNRIAEIQYLKVFIGQGNFFSKKIHLKSLHISNANFFIKKSNFKYIKNFFSKKFSKKMIKINKSKIFFKDNDDEAVFIYTIDNINALYDNVENKNNFSMRGKLFNIENKVNHIKNFDNQKKITKISAKKIYLNFQNEANLDGDQYDYINTLEIKSNKFKTNYKINKDNISFFSKKSFIKNTLINYEGNIDLNPFNLSLKIKSKELNLDSFFKNLNLFNEILISKLLFKKNLYAEIQIISENITKAKIFNKADIKINFQGGEINLNNTILFSDKIGDLKLSNSKFIVDNNDLIFEGNSKLNIKNLNYFYKIFLLPKKNRIKLGSIDFFFQVNPKTGNIKIKNIILYNNEGNRLDTKLSNDLLSGQLDEEFSYLNPIKFKNFLKDFLIDYSDEG